MHVYPSPEAARRALSRRSSSSWRRLLDEMTHTPSELIVIAGLWLTCAPLVLDHGKADIAFLGWNDVVVGLAMVGLAFIRVVAPQRTAPLSLIQAALGAWLIAAPFVRGYQSAIAATVNDVLVGVAVMVLALLSWNAARRWDRTAGR